MQKLISAVAFGSMAAMIVISALDFRFGWSTVPAAVSVVGDVLVAVGLTIAMLVTIQNGYAAANITVESGQQLSSTGWYGFVRHPMYFGNVILMIGVPLALGSYWGLLIVIAGLVVLALRINDEEALLTAGVGRIPRIHAEGALPAGALRLVRRAPLATRRETPRPRRTEARYSR